MKTSKLFFPLAPLAFILCLASAAHPQMNSERARDVSKSMSTRSVPDGQELKLSGIVVKRDIDLFTVREPNGAETVVALTDATNIKTERKGLFRADEKSGVSYILRGLRLKVEGRGNSEGQLVATKIRFTEQDLRTAQALAARVDPVESTATETKALAENNRQRVSELEQNAQKMSGQIDELSALAAANREAVKVAQASADRAQASADCAQTDAAIANERINGLDDYDVLETFMVHFRSGSAVLTPAAKYQIDLAAARVKGENLRGWLIEVVGYADSTGKSPRNRSLSERRAQAVINYLVTKYKLPLRRLVQPFGYGELNPVAANETRQGRSLNRRVEIKVMVNKAYAAQAGK